MARFNLARATAALDQEQAELVDAIREMPGYFLGLKLLLSSDVSAIRRGLELADDDTIADVARLGLMALAMVASDRLARLEDEGVPL